ncbi:MAG: hypothetical protein AAGI66_08635 [Cyanobacteria bacterium P01_H01_bin.74]
MNPKVLALTLEAFLTSSFRVPNSVQYPLGSSRNLHRGKHQKGLPSAYFSHPDTWLVSGKPPGAKSLTVLKAYSDDNDKGKNPDPKKTPLQTVKKILTSWVWLVLVSKNPAGNLNTRLSKLLRIKIPKESSHPLALKQSKNKTGPVETLNSTQFSRGFAGSHLPSKSPKIFDLRYMDVTTPEPLGVGLAANEAKNDAEEFADALYTELFAKTDKANLTEANLAWDKVITLAESLPPKTNDYQILAAEEFPPMDGNQKPVYLGSQVRNIFDKFAQSDKDNKALPNNAFFVALTQLTKIFRGRNSMMSTKKEPWEKELFYHLSILPSPSLFKERTLQTLDNEMAELTSNDLEKINSVTRDDITYTLLFFTECDEAFREYEASQSKDFKSKYSLLWAPRAKEDQYPKNYIQFKEWLIAIAGSLLGAKSPFSPFDTKI